MEAGDRLLQEAVSCGGMVSQEFQNLFGERNVRRTSPGCERTPTRHLRHSCGAAGRFIGTLTMADRTRFPGKVKARMQQHSDFLEQRSSIVASASGTASKTNSKPGVSGSAFKMRSSGRSKL